MLHMWMGLHLLHGVVCSIPLVVMILILCIHEMVIERDDNIFNALCL